MPGGGRFQVEQRIRYTGEARVFHRGQRTIQPGEEGVVVHDFGFDYRYLVRLDKAAGPRMFHRTAGGVIFDIRPGSSWDWEPA